MHDIVTAIWGLCRRYVKWAEEMLFLRKNIARQKYRLCGTLQRPFPKRLELRKYFSEKFSAAKIKKVRLAEIHSHPSCGFFCAQNRTSKNAPAITIKNIVLTSAISLVTYLIV
ncbi:MAG: hypothetical protein IJ062_13450 [Firmicutes bacterium]|nr:hypothetical protein [Bacillota bacterium]